MERRRFLAMSAGVAGGLCLGDSVLAAGAKKKARGKAPFKISLAEWSFHRHLFGQVQPKMDNLDFAKTAAGLGIKGLEYVNQFFKDKAKDEKYLAELKKRAKDNGVRSLIIMCDGEGNLGDPDTAKRDQAVTNHYKWVEAAKYLGCHSIRVNAHSSGTYEEQMKLVTDGLRRLCEFGAKHKLNVIVENHGGLSSNPKWLCGVMKAVDMKNCGTLPDFGNFPDDIDRYEAVKEMMQYAKSVSAKTYGFDAVGNESKIDYYKMMDIVIEAGYKEFVGIEFEGAGISEKDGVLATKKLLEKIQQMHLKA